MKTGLGLHVLLVEDNDDIREGLSTLLDSEGYAVTEARTAEEGLAHLRQRPFKLVVTDYMLPARSGAWMLEEALRDRLLCAANVLMVTAHPKVKAPAGGRLLLKPLDIDDFLREVALIIASAPPPEPAARAGTGLE
jgi:DNA-binding response OmpR family regulator